MTAANTQTAFFPGVAPAISRRGRGATPVVAFKWTATHPNPAGRSGLSFRFRPLTRHQTPLEGGSKPHWQVACNLLTHLFATVGGFRLADDQVVRIWADALELYTAQEVRWAIDAKAASLRGETPAETRDKRRFTGRPESFAFAYWLEQSEHYQRQVDQQRRVELDAALAERVRARQAEDDRARSAGQAVLDALHAKRAADAECARAQHDRDDREFWDSLSDAQRSHAWRAIKTEWLQYCRNMCMDPEDPELDGVLQTWLVDQARRLWPPKEGNKATRHQGNEAPRQRG